MDTLFAGEGEEPKQSNDNGDEDSKKKKILYLAIGIAVIVVVVIVWVYTTGESGSSNETLDNSSSSLPNPKVVKSVKETVKNGIKNVGSVLKGGFLTLLSIFGKSKPSSDTSQKKKREEEDEEEKNRKEPEATYSSKDKPEVKRPNSKNSKPEPAKHKEEEAFEHQLKHEEEAAAEAHRQQLKREDKKATSSKEANKREKAREVPSADQKPFRFPLEYEGTQDDYVELYNRTKNETWKFISGDRELKRFFSKNPENLATYLAPELNNLTYCNRVTTIKQKWVKDHSREISEDELKYFYSVDISTGITESQKAEKVVHSILSEAVSKGYLDGESAGKLFNFTRRS